MTKQIEKRGLGDLLKSELGKRIRWLLISRFALFVVIFIAIFYSHPKDPIVYYLFLIYGGTTLGYLLALYYHHKFNKDAPYKFSCGVALGLEILIEIVLIHITGGASSQFIFLLPLTIFTAAFVFRLTGTLIVTAVSSALYSILIVAEFYNWIAFNRGSPLVSIIYANGEALFFTAYIYICFFFIIAFLAGFLSRKLHSQVETIEILGTALSHLKVSTGELIDRLSTGVLTVDRDGIITYFNKSARDILGIDVGESANKSVYEILPDKLSTIAEEIKAFIDDPKLKTHRKEFTITTGDDKRVDLKFSINELEVGNQSYGMLIVFEDITQEKRRQKLLEQVEKLTAIGDISARFAHEIRNPLASIRGSVEMLMGNINLPPEDKRLFELVIRESDRLTDLLEDFLAFARLKELPMEQFVANSVDLGQVFDDILILTKNHPAYHNEIVLENRIPKNSLFVKAQEEHLRKAFSNIVINAYQAIGDKPGTVVVDTAPDRDDLFEEERMAGITITDSGKGMTESEIENLFTPFVTTRKTGFGLGMAIAQNVIAKHNGFIEIESKPNQGSRFTIYLKKANNNDKNIF